MCVDDVKVMVVSRFNVLKVLLRLRSVLIPNLDFGSILKFMSLKSKIVSQ